MEVDVAGIGVLESLAKTMNLDLEKDQGLERDLNWQACSMKLKGLSVKVEGLPMETNKLKAMDPALAWTWASASENLASLEVEHLVMATE
jgi:hypothetical protein